MRIVATIEARVGSSRLPGKVLKKFGDVTSLELMVERVKKSKLVSDVVIATTVSSKDDEIVKLAEKINCKYYRGSEDDVLERVLLAAQSASADIIVELTGDCPFLDGELIDDAIETYQDKKVDYFYNRLIPGLPDGFDVQVFSLAKLKEISLLTNDPIDRVHVSCYFYNNPDKYLCSGKEIPKDSVMFWPDLGLTLDQMEDYKFLGEIYNKLVAKEGNNFTARSIMKLLKSNPELTKINSEVKRKQLSDG